MYIMYLDRGADVYSRAKAKLNGGKPIQNAKVSFAFTGYSFEESVSKAWYWASELQEAGMIEDIGEMEINIGKGFPTGAFIIVEEAR